MLIKKWGYNNYFPIFKGPYPTLHNKTLLLYNYPPGCNSARRSQILAIETRPKTSYLLDTQANARSHAGQITVAYIPTDLMLNCEYISLYN